MDFLTSAFTNIVPFLIILTVLVFVHELGHYLVARWNGVKVEVFSIGFGPEIVGWNDKHATRWKISAIPLGGYVKMFADADASSRQDAQKMKTLSEEEMKLTLHGKSVWQRIQVSAAGPLANYIFAILVFGAIFATRGEQVPSENAQAGMVVPGSAAEKAGILEGDVISTVNGKSVKNFQEMSEIVKNNPGKELDFDLKRGEKEINLKVTPETVETLSITGEKTQTGKLGVAQGFVSIKHGVIQSFGIATKYVINVSWMTLKGIGEMIIGNRKADGLSGPLGIAKMTAVIAQTDIWNILWFAAFLSLNLGLINLLPIPVLDGGHLLFYVIEAIKGSPVSEKTQEYAFRAGLGLILFVFLLSTWNDVNRFEWVRNLFG